METIFKQKGLFEEIRKKRPDVATLIEKRVAGMLTDVNSLIDQNGHKFALEPPGRSREYKDKAKRDNVVLSFGKQSPPVCGSFYIGIDVLKKIKWSVGDLVWIRDLTERPAVYDKELLSVIDHHRGKSYTISDVPYVVEYKRVCFPLSFFNFTPWKGRRELLHTAATGSLAVRFPGTDL